MRYDSGSAEAGQNILVVGSCSFRRLAICHCLLSRCAGVTDISSLEDIPAGRECNIDGVVISLEGTLPELMRTLRPLAALLIIAPIPVVLITDMSPCCALALLILSGVPGRVAGNIRVIPACLKATRFRCLLLAALEEKHQISGVDRCRGLLLPLHLNVLRNMIDGIDDVALGRAAGVTIKTIYSRRYTTLKRLQVAGQHALLCGRFVSLQQEAEGHQ